jgi:hypothetical protein
MFPTIKLFLQGLNLRASIQGAMQDDFINEVKAKCILNRGVKSTVLASFSIKITSGKQTDSTILGQTAPDPGL